MKAFLDTPLLVYLNTVADEGRRRVYEDFYIRLLTQYKLYTDILVLDELVYVSRRKYGVPYSLTLDFIRDIVLPYVSLLSLGEEEYSKADEILRRHSIKPSDAIHVAAMVNNGIAVIVSEDVEFDRLPMVKRLWLDPGLL